MKINLLKYCCAIIFVAFGFSLSAINEPINTTYSKGFLIVYDYNYSTLTSSTIKYYGTDVLTMSTTRVSDFSQNGIKQIKMLEDFQAKKNNTTCDPGYSPTCGLYISSIYEGQAGQLYSYGATIESDASKSISTSIGNFTGINNSWSPFIVTAPRFNITIGSVVPKNSLVAYPISTNIPANTVDYWEYRSIDSTNWVKYPFSDGLQTIKFCTLDILSPTQGRNWGGQYVVRCIEKKQVTIANFRRSSNELTFRYNKITTPPITLHQVNHPCGNAPNGTISSTSSVFKVLEYHTSTSTHPGSFFRETSGVTYAPGVYLDQFKVCFADYLRDEQNLLTISNLIVFKPLSIVTNSTNSCINASNGTISINISGGSFDDLTKIGTSSWVRINNAEQRQITKDNIGQGFVYTKGAGTYNISVFDAVTNCIKSQQVTVLNYPDISASATTINASCNNVNGSATISIAGGPSGSALTVNLVGSNQAAKQVVNGSVTFNGLSSGKYSVEVTTSIGGCSKLFTDLVDVKKDSPAALSINPTASYMECPFTGAVTLTANGGSGVYTYSKTDVASDYTSTQTFGGLAAGSIATYYVKDSKGCKANASTTSTSIGTFPAFTCTLVTPATPFYLQCSGNTASAIFLCSGGNPNKVLQASINGGPWLNVGADGKITFTGLAAGTYSVSVKRDDNLCVKTFNNLFTVTPPSSALSLSLTSTSSYSECPGTGKITLNGANGWGGLTYSSDNVNYNSVVDYPNLSAGTVRIFFVKDNKGCVVSSTTTSSTIGVFPAFTCTLVSPSTNPLMLKCKKDVTSVTVSCSGGNPSYKLEASIDGGAYWSEVVNGKVTFNSVKAGTYSIRVRRSDGLCFKDFNNFIVIKDPDIALSLAATPSPSFVECATGSVKLVASNGWNSSYTFSDNNSTFSSSQTFLSIPANTTKSFYVKDAGGCIVSTSSTVTALQPFSITPANTLIALNCYGKDTTLTIKCAGGVVGNSDGTLKASINNGTTWVSADINGNAVFNGVKFGTYSVIVKRVSLAGADICSKTFLNAISITQPTNSLTANISSWTNINCKGELTGTVTASGGGGTSPYTYSWNTTPISQTSATASNLPAGNYTCTVRDFKGCLATVSKLISEPQTAPTVNFPSVTNVLCYGAATGAITASGSGGVLPYTYRWNTTPIAQSSATAIGLPAGSYKCTITDATGCTANSTKLITQPNNSLVAAPSVTPPLCFGGLATVSANASGGTAPYSYLWKNSSNVIVAGTSASNSSMPAGLDSVIITDLNKCVSRNGVMVNNPPKPTFTATITNPNCSGDLATITFTSIADKYFINGVEVAKASAKTVPIGTSSVNLSVQKGICLSDPVSFSIVKPNILSFTTTPTAPTCYNGKNGKLTLAINGGNATTTYTYNIGQGVVNLPSTKEISNLTANKVYNITLYDSKGCSATVTSPAIPNKPAWVWNTTIINPTCSANGEIKINSITNGTANYIDSVGGFNVINYTYKPLPVGTKKITVKDANNCYQSTSINLSTVPLVFKDSTTTPVKCRGEAVGAIRISVEGGRAPYNFALTPSKPLTQVTTTGNLFNATNLSKGIYTLTVTDASGCSLIRKIAINEPAGKTTFTTSCIYPTNCVTTGTITINATPYNCALNQLTYQINSEVISGNVRSGLSSSSSYRVIVTDALTCKDTSDVPFLQHNISGNAVVYPVTCNNGTNGKIVVNNLAGGNGALRVAVRKEGAVGDTTYVNYLNTDLPFVGLVPGNYNVYVKDSRNCSVWLGSKIVANVNPIKLSYTPTAPNCFGFTDGSAKLNITGGSNLYNFTVKGTNYTNKSTGVTISGLSGGVTYPIVLTDTNGCPNNGAGTVTSITIPQKEQFRLSLTRVDSVDCKGKNTGAISLTASGGNKPYKQFTVSPAGTYSITTGNDGTFSISNASAGSYTFGLSDDKGCVLQNSAGTVSIKEPAELVLGIGAINLPKCSGYSDGNITLTASGGNGGYYFSEDGSEFDLNAFRNGLAANTHSFYLRDRKGCNDTIQYTLSQPDSVKLVNLNLQNPSCSNNSGTINPVFQGGNGSYLYKLDDETDFLSSVLCQVSSGAHKLTFEDSQHCTNKAIDFSIVAPQPLSVTTEIDSARCAGLQGRITVKATGGTRPYRYKINNEALLNDSVFNRSAGVYTITVVDKNNCSANTLVEIKEPAVLTFSTTPVPPTCRDNSTGQLQLQITGGNPGKFYYHLNSDINSTELNANSIIYNQLPGNYAVKVLDSKGCEFSNPNVVISNVPKWQWEISEDVTPTLGNNGEITVKSIVGGSAPYKVQLADTSLWSVPYTYHSIGAGYTKLVGKDSKGCFQDTIYKVGFSPLKISNCTHKDVVCKGDNSGKIEFAVSGGRTPFTYLLNGTISPSQTKSSANSDTVFVQFNNLPAGSLDLKIIDSSNGRVDTTVIISEPLNKMTFDVQTVEPSSCELLGTISVHNVSAYIGNSSLLTYSLGGSKFQSSNIFPNISTGKYKIFVKDEAQCIVSVDKILNPEQFSDSLAATPIRCNNELNGSVSIININPRVVPMYTALFPLSEAPVGKPSDALFIRDKKEYTNLPKGIYVVWAKDDIDKCKISLGQVEVKDVPPISFTYHSDAPKCFGYKDGRAHLKLQGGSGSYEVTVNNTTYTVSSPIDTLLVDGLEAKSYPVVLKDKNGCTNQSTLDSIVVDSKDPLVLAKSQLNGVSCNGLTDGSLQVEALGGNGGYTFEVFKNSVKYSNYTVNDRYLSIPNSGKATYTFTVSDKFNCPFVGGDDTLEIKEPEVLSLIIDSIDNPTCNRSNGVAYLSAVGGKGNYLYSRDGINYSTIDSITNLSPEVSYTLWAFDGKCSDSKVVKLSNTPLPSLSNLNLHNPLCSDSVGLISPEFSGGIGKILIKLDSEPNFNSNIYRSVTSGEHTLYFEDMNQCEVSYPFNVTAPTPLQLTTKITAPQCNGLSGAIELQGNGGSGGYKYLIDNTPTTETIIQRASGNYVVTLLDKNQCSLKDTVQIIEPSVFTASAIANQPLCRDGVGSIVVTTVGNITDSIEYKLNSDADFKRLPLNKKILGLTPGDYIVTVREKNKTCEAKTNSVTLSNPAAWSINSVVTPATCSANGSVTLSATNEKYYKLVGNNDLVLPCTIANLSSGISQFKVSNGNCIQDISVNITEASLKLSLSLKNVTCKGGTNGSLLVAITGGRGKYQWSLKDESNAIKVGVQDSNNPNTIRFEGLKRGTYNLSVQDESGCSKTEIVTITEPTNQLSFDFDQVNATFCTQYGTITVKNVTNFLGDYEQLSYKITGRVYQPSNHFASVEKSYANNPYVITVIDSAGCVADKTTFMRPLKISFDTLYAVAERCYNAGDGRIVIKGVNGEEGQLIKTAVSQSLSIPDISQFKDQLEHKNLKPGKYAVYAAYSGSSCVEKQGDVVVDAVAPLSFSYISINPTCYNGSNGSATVTIKGGNGGYKFEVDNQILHPKSNIFTISSKKAGYYPVVLTDTLQCANFGAVKAITIKETPQIVTSLVSKSDVTCFGNNNGSIDVLISNGVSPINYSVYKNDLAISSLSGSGSAISLANILEPGVYKFLVTDKDGCKSDSSTIHATINQPQPLSLKVASYSNLTCAGIPTGSIVLEAKGGNLGTLFFSQNGTSKQTSPLFNNLVNSDYKLSVEDSKGCKASVNQLITAPSVLELGATITHPNCFGDSGMVVASIKGGTITPTKSYQIKIEGITEYVAPKTIKLKGGIYTLKAKDSNECEIQKSITVVEPSKLTLSASVTKPLCSGYEGKIVALANGGTPTYSYKIGSNQYSPTTTFGVKKGIYSIAVSDTKGCIAVKDSIKIDEPNPLILSQTVTNPVCRDYLGGIELVAKEGTAPYKFTTNFTTTFPTTGNLNGVAGQTVKFDNLASGASYRSAVMDANGCVLALEPVTIVNPAKLAWGSETITNPKCANDGSGKVSLTLTGGWGDYSYTLNTITNKTGVFSGLSGGDYMIKASDTKGCVLVKSFALSNPTPIELKTSVTPQKCFSNCDGAISVSSSGGWYPHTISWNNSALGSSGSLTKKCGGTYIVTVTDANNCFVTKDLSFATPLQINPTVGFKDTTLCKGQTLTVIPTPKDKWSLKWSKGGAQVATGSSYTVNSAGSYTVNAADVVGCNENFNFNVNYSTEELNPDFLMSSKVAATDTITIIDITNPRPLNVSWIYDSKAKLVEKTDGYISLVFNEPGTYKLGIMANSSLCSVYKQKNIVVGPKEDKFEINKSLGAQESILKSLKVSPNPTYGDFKVTILLNKKIDVSVELLSVSSGMTLEKKNLVGADKYEVSYSKKDLLQGLYFVRVIVDGKPYIVKLVKI